ncbi:fimbrial biogenesis chaperone [Variovorax paradoxus]|uniref:fimbrial biogenesis chaperone n=1 Tax=Variovorax paradoxus TaxID=34073 RepID=UPI003D64EABD
MTLRAFSALAIALSCCVAPASAGSSGLQVSPVTLTIHPEQAADGIWASNAGAGALHAQVRVYRWTQEAGEEQLLPTEEVVVSPPMVRLRPHDRQLVRTIRAGPPPSGDAEQAFRLLIDEIPVASQGEARSDGLKFLLRYSLPIFLAPKEGAAPAQLHWSLLLRAGHPVLQVFNAGGTHAQLADIGYTDINGRRFPLHAGLLGYVLPGATMRWPLQAHLVRPESTGVWDATVNGRTARQTVKIDTPAP